MAIPEKIFRRAKWHSKRLRTEYRFSDSCENQRATRVLQVDCGQIFKVHAARSHLLMSTSTADIHAMTIRMRHCIEQPCQAIPL
eukprot:scaffold126393_cov26-Prasinocladus_malaysianus.AAC.1